MRKRANEKLEMGNEERNGRGRKEKQKILPENSLGVSPRIKAVSRQQYAKKQNAIFLNFMLKISYKSQPTALAPSTAAELPSRVEIKNLALPLKIFNTLLS